ncbi:MAG: histidine kinase [Phycisphaerae bacterium SM1_79]|nr:MAG: histidine kinase [Phycisphaerae bacterium SM1_79]
MKTLSEILDAKGRNVWSVSPQNTAYEALELMADKDVGALVVMDEGKLVGMFSERDYARKVILKGKSSRETAVADVMTKPVCWVHPWSNLNECMALMTNRHVRHLPVLDKDRLVGIVTIGDVVKAIISEQKSVIHELKGYVDEALKGRPEENRKP